MITRDFPGGFFSNFIWALEGIGTAMERDLKPIVRIEKILRPASLPRTLMGLNSETYDFYEYFSPKEYRKEDIRTSSPSPLMVDEAKGSWPKDVESLRLIFFANLRVADRVTTIKQSVAENLGLEFNKFLGVHVRGSDMRWQPSHPTPPSLRQLRNASSIEAEKSGLNLVYIAGDQKSTLRKMRFGLKPKFTPVGLQDYRGMYQREIQSDANLRVLLDALLLSDSHSMVHSQSNVSLAARVFRASKHWRRIELDCGINAEKLHEAVFWAVMRTAKSFSLFNGLSPGSLSRCVSGNASGQPWGQDCSETLRDHR